MSDVKQFHEQVKKGDLAGVRATLAGDPELLNTINPAGQSAFLLAKYYRQDAIAEYLLSLDPKLDIFNSCVAGRTSAVLSDIDRDPALLRSQSTDGWTVLHLAAFFGHAELANALLDRGANVNSRSTNGLKNTPLHAASAGGHAELVALLLKRGADPNARQEGGWTALHSAALAGNRPMAEALLANGADTSIRADNNQAALDLALSKGHGELATLLENAGARLQ